ncbi:MAG: histone [Candidatus Hadarchaeia archaeon]
MTEFSLSSMKRLIKRGGSERVSEDASFELRAILERSGKKISNEAIRKAEHEKIKTIKKRHIKAAVQDLEL